MSARSSGERARSTPARACRSASSRRPRFAQAVAAMRRARGFIGPSGSNSITASAHRSESAGRPALNALDHDAHHELGGDGLGPRRGDGQCRTRRPSPPRDSDARDRASDPGPEVPGVSCRRSRERSRHAGVRRPPALGNRAPRARHRDAAPAPTRGPGAGSSRPDCRGGWRGSPPRPPRIVPRPDRSLPAGTGRRLGATRKWRFDDAAEQPRLAIAIAADELQRPSGYKDEPDPVHRRRADDQREIEPGDPGRLGTPT